MRHTGILFLYIAFIVFVHIPLQAQTTFISPNLSVETGTVFSTDLKVASFSHIIGTQFTLNWDSNILKFKDIQNLNPTMELTLIDNFGAVDAGSGVLSFQWYDQSLNGVSLEDSTRIFSIQFEAVGAPQSATELQFTDNPTMREVADTSFEAIEAAFIAGTISLVGPVSSRAELAEGPVNLTAFPNPFKERTDVTLTVPVAINAHIGIYNTHGQLIYEQQQNYSAGSHTLHLEKHVFTEAGIYYLKLAASDFSVTRRLILVQ